MITLVSKKIAGTIGLGATAIGAAAGNMTSANLFDLMKDNKETQQQYLQQTLFTKNFAAAENIVKRMLEILPKEGRVETIKTLKKIVNNSNDLTSEETNIVNNIDDPNSDPEEVLNLLKNLLNEAKQKDIGLIYIAASWVSLVLDTKPHLKKNLIWISVTS